MSSYISLKEYMKKHNYSKKEAEKSLEFVKNTIYCPCCKKILIPSDAKAYYIPKKCYKDSSFENYYYVIDAISQKKEIEYSLTKFTKDECKSFVKELREYGYIKLICGRKDSSLMYYDYYVSIKGVEWENLNNNEKRKIVLNILQLVVNATTIASRIM